ncbi:unnamed protein product [Penicillium salamii]|nr:unnamed protein product [Penicillium salamii]CAG8408084.1 unnamed protein product [Penicillium salamii]
MAGIVNGPLSIFRKSDSPKPLHARWGDVSISVPTDGSWNQYDNPHRPVKERSSYGPGYVPDTSPQDRTPRPFKEEADDDDASVCSTSSTASRRSSLSLSGLKPGRLSVRLASRPKHQSDYRTDKDARHSNQSRNDFAYRPIHQDYTSEVTEKPKQPSNRFKYIPTSGRYLQDSGALPPRSQSVSSHRSHSYRDSYAESVDEDHFDRGYGSSTRFSTHEDNRLSFRDSIGDVSDGSRRNYGLPPRRRTSPFVSADRNRASTLKPVTMAMVPDPDELYDEQWRTQWFNFGAVSRCGWAPTHQTHPTCFLLAKISESISRRTPHLVGKSVDHRWGPEIPFLPKTSSSPRSCTRKTQRSIAIALSKFELFAGWKPLDHIETLFRLNHLAKYMPQENEFTDEALRQVCKALLNAPPKEVVQTTKDLQAIPESHFGAHSYIPSLLGRLAKQYGEDDNGNLVAALLMNYLTLGPGDSVFVPADSIHAYLEGDIVECMARSDNVINTGFCPAADRDSVELFGEALSFTPHKADDALLPRRKSDKGMKGKTDVYAPPISEFAVLCTTLGAGEEETHKAILGPSLMVVTKGSGQMNIPGNQTVELSEGWVFFVGQGVALDFATDKGMAVYRAYAE